MNKTPLEVIRGVCALLWDPKTERPPECIELPAQGLVPAATGRETNRVYLLALLGLLPDVDPVVPVFADAVMQATGFPSDAFDELKLSLWNKTNASPPWSAKELGHKVDDAYRNA